VLNIKLLLFEIIINWCTCIWPIENHGLSYNSDSKHIKGHDFDLQSGQDHIWSGTEKLIPAVTKTDENEEATVKCVIITDVYVSNLSKFKSILHHQQLIFLNITQWKFKKRLLLINNNYKYYMYNVSNSNFSKASNYSCLKGTPLCYKCVSYILSTQQRPFNIMISKPDNSEVMSRHILLEMLTLSNRLWLLQRFGNT